MVIDGYFGPFRPDMPDLDNPGVTTANNVIAAQGPVQGAIAYQPVKQSKLYASTTMAGRPIGTAVGQDSSGNAKVYAGSATALYKMNPLDTKWLDISRAGGYTTTDGERWKSSEFGNLVIFTNYSDEPQYIVKDTDVQFANLTTVVKARHSAVVRDFHVFGNTYDATDGSVPYRVRWSAYGNPFDYNFSQQTMSDFQDIYEGGAVQAIIGGEHGYILLQRSIVKMTFIGGQLIFQFDQILDKGCSIPNSVISVEGRTYFVSDDGFWVLVGDQIAPIGSGKIDNFFLNDIDTSANHLMTVAADPRQKLIYWSYKSKSSSTDNPDRLLIFNYGIGEWTTADNMTGFIFNSMSLPWTIEALDVFGSIENVPAPFDSPVWAGGNAMLWSADSTGNVYVFGGDNLRGTLETRESLFIQQLQRIDRRVVGDRTTIFGVRPLVEGNGTISVVGKHRGTLSSASVISDARTTNDETGWSYFRHENRFHRFNLRLDGNWTQAIGYQIDAHPAGFR